MCVVHHHTSVRNNQLSNTRGLAQPAQMVNSVGRRCPPSPLSASIASRLLYSGVPDVHPRVALVRTGEESRRMCAITTSGRRAMSSALSIFIPLAVARQVLEVFCCQAASDRDGKET